MGDWDAPAPWYVYTTGGTALALFGCLANNQWRWSIIVGLALLVSVMICVWRHR